MRRRPTASVRTGPWPVACWRTVLASARRGRPCAPGARRSRHGRSNLWSGCARGSFISCCGRSIPRRWRWSLAIFPLPRRRACSCACRRRCAHCCWSISAGWPRWMRTSWMRWTVCLPGRLRKDPCRTGVPACRWQRRSWRLRAGMRPGSCWPIWNGTTPACRRCWAGWFTVLKTV